jgi:hypothetical protein
MKKGKKWTFDETKVIGDWIISNPDGIDYENWCNKYADKIGRGLGGVKLKMDRLRKELALSRLTSGSI